MDKAYVMYNGRLALFRRTANSEFWDQRFQEIPDNKLAHTLRPSKALNSHHFFFKKWIPNDGVVLEAGAGTGIWVRRLLENGWNCIGVDYALNSLIRSKRITAELPLVGADVFQLPFSDNSLAAYISFGVIEHFPDGPQQILRECVRVLRPGGIALISVPYHNAFRKRMDTVPADKALERGLEFYQFYFDKAELENELLSAGLSPTGSFHGYSVALGISESIIGRLVQRLGSLQVLLDFLPILNTKFPHMIFTAALKPSIKALE